MGRLTDKITLMALSDQESGVRKIMIPRWVVDSWRTLLIVVGIAIFLQAVAIGFLVFQLAKYKGIRANNEFLLEENAQINRIVGEFKELQKLNAQIRRALGVNLGLEPDDSTMSDTTTLALFEAPIPNGSVTRPGSVNRDNIPQVPAWLSQGFTSRDIPTFLPVEGFITQNYLWIEELQLRNHPAIDIAAAEGTPVLASADGMVTFSDWTYRYGNLIILYHRSGYFTVYGHLQLRTCNIRDWVRQGEPIGLLGNSGVSSAPHLHFEIWKGNQPVNPRDFTWGLSGN